MWYSNLYRRHLLDMHIEDWHPDFLRDLSPETYVENLKKAEINYAMIYLQSHAGLCYYPTKVGVIHKRFEREPELMKRMVELCHAAGIRVCGYYSLIFNTREHDRHPEWRMKDKNGLSRRESGAAGTDLAFASAKGGRYGHCCPSNPEYRAFVNAQIDEMLDYFDLDALFFDMPFWPHTCHCAYCQKELPESGPARLEYKARKMGELVQGVTDHVKSRCPEMPVEHNFAQAVAGNTACSCMEEVLAACDYVGGDLYGDLYNHSFACKFYKNATKNQPFEQMFSRCKPALRMHTLTKSPDEMKTAMASTMAHHGATLVIDAIDPCGTMDERVYAQVGEIFRFQKQYEPYFTGEMVEEVGLYYGMRSRIMRESNSRTCCANAGKTMARAHIPFGVTGSFHHLNYKILAAPLLSELEKDERLTDYVQNGGVIYLSGCGNVKLVEKLTGNRFVKMTEEKSLYYAPKPGYEEIFGGFNEKYPLPFEEPAPVVEPGKAEILATLTFPYTKPQELRFAAIHSDPPGVPSEIPAVTVNPYGKGWVIWSALPIENMRYEEYRQIFLNLLHLKGKPDYFFKADAPANVELTAFENERSITLHAVVLDEETVTAPAAPFTVRVKGEAKAVRLLPGGEEIPFAVEKGETVFQTRTLNIYDLYEIEKG
ncbi:MAG: alpha-L-fucosidase [Clostridia bacterium]|nr:alpha-L-fucosidase [Clostridia bacterium]